LVCIASSLLATSNEFMEVWNVKFGWKVCHEILSK
jgi:hypothetical protein